MSRLEDAALERLSAVVETLRRGTHSGTVTWRKTDQPGNYQYRSSGANIFVWSLDATHSVGGVGMSVYDPLGSELVTFESSSRGLHESFIRYQLEQGLRELLGVIEERESALVKRLDQLVRDVDLEVNQQRPST